MAKSRGKVIVLFLPLALACSVPLSAAEQLTFTPYHSSGIYQVGEKVGWAVTEASPTGDTHARFTWTARKNNMETVKTGSLDLSSGKATIEVEGTEPGMLYVEINGDPPSPT